MRKANLGKFEVYFGSKINYYFLEKPLKQSKMQKM